MKDLRTSKTTYTVPDGSAIEAFNAGLRGELLRPGDAGYEDARRVWNGMIDERSALIARCASVAYIISPKRGSTLVFSQQYSKARLSEMIVRRQSVR